MKIRKIVASKKLERRRSESSYSSAFIFVSTMFLPVTGRQFAPSVEQCVDRCLGSLASLFAAARGMYAWSLPSFIRLSPIRLSCCFYSVISVDPGACHAGSLLATQKIRIVVRPQFAQANVSYFLTCDFLTFPGQCPPPV